MTQDSKIVTAPDFDYTNNFKFLFVDFNPEEIDSIVSILQRAEEPLTVYLYNEEDKDYKWCILAAQMADAILVNTANRTNHELLKGYLLSFSNASAYGFNEHAVFAKSLEVDLFAWVTKILAQKKNIDF